jgi:acyl-CoA synthetase (AMP-forming)/AMP-acid ligase II
MHKRSERIALTILDRIEVKSSDHIALLYPPCVDLVSAFYACLYIGNNKQISNRKKKVNFYS